MLIITVKRGQPLIVDGVEMTFNRSVEVIFHNDARFLAGSWIMRPTDAVTTEAKFYLAIQTAYIGPRDRRETSWKIACRLADIIGTDAAHEMIELAGAGKFYEALKIGRSDRVLNNLTSPPKLSSAE